MTNICKLCGKRRARRYCPGVSGEICPICCGTERENTVDCPLDCEHLQESRRHERPPGIKNDGAAADIPHRDIQLSEQFLTDHEGEILWLAHALARAIESGGAVDPDAREALDSLVRMYRTLESGLIYQTRPQNPYAAGIQEAMQKSIEELRQRMMEESGLHQLRDSDVLGALVFLQRLELHHNNGRRRGRAFFDLLRAQFPMPAKATLAL